MIALHLSVSGEHLALWGEATPEGEVQEETAQGEPVHPAATTAATTAARMAGVLGEIGIRRGQEGERWAWLPTRAGRPLPSSPLLEPEGDGRAEDALCPSDDSPSDDSPSEEPPTLAAWRVPVLLLSGQDTGAFLSAATGRQMLAPGVLLGDSVAFWAQAYRFAAALVAREQFLPGLADTAAGWRAQWEPLFIGDDAERLAGLARAMPHACRALSESPQRAPESAPADLLRRRLGSFTDDLVRTAIAERKPAAAPRFDSVHDRWLHALRSPDGQMEGDASDLAESIRLWRRRLVATTEAPFRLTFRLEEPPSPLFDGGHPDEAARARQLWPRPPSPARGPSARSCKPPTIPASSSTSPRPGSRARRRRRSSPRAASRPAGTCWRRSGRRWTCSRPSPSA